MFPFAFAVSNVGRFLVSGFVAGAVSLFSKKLIEKQNKSNNNEIIENISKRKIANNNFKSDIETSISSSISSRYNRPTLLSILNSNAVEISSHISVLNNLLSEKNEILSKILENQTKTALILENIYSSFNDKSLLRDFKVIDNDISSSKVADPSLNVIRELKETIQNNFEKSNLKMDSLLNVFSNFAGVITNNGVNIKISNPVKFETAVKENQQGVIKSIEKFVDVFSKTKLKAVFDTKNPVKIKMQDEILANQKANLDIKQKTYDIYKEKAEFEKSKQEVKDLDGKVIANISPREAVVSKNVLDAKIQGDENSFELDDEDFNFLNFDFSNLSKLFNIELPNKINEKYFKE